MNLPKLEQAILIVVNNNTGIKGVELALDIMARMIPKNYKKEEYEEILQNLVNTGQIVILDYFIPSMDYKVKSIYFPKGTTFTFTLPPRS